MNASVSSEEDDDNATAVLALARSCHGRGRLSEYASEHDAAISKARSEADALLLEYSALDFSGMEESQSEVALLAAARASAASAVAAAFA